MISCDGFANLDDLRGAGLRMDFDLPPLGPIVRIVMMADVAEQQRAVGTMDDQAQIAAASHRPEARIFRAIELVELQARMLRIRLQIERGGLDGFLLVGR